jgi:hypothetical protein
MLKTLKFHFKAPIFSLALSNALLHGLLLVQSLFAAVGSQYLLTEHYCRTLFSLTITAGLSSGLWTTAIAVDLRHSLYNHNSKARAYHVIIWPIVLAILAVLWWQKASAPQKFFMNFACGLEDVKMFIFLDLVAPLVSRLSRYSSIQLLTQVCCFWIPTAGLCCESHRNDSFRSSRISALPQ